VSRAWLIFAAAGVVACGSGFSEHRSPDFSSSAIRRGTVVVLPLTVAESELQIPWPIRESASSSACAELRKHRQDLRIACYADYAHSPAWPALDDLANEIAAKGRPSEEVLTRARQVTGARYFLAFFARADVKNVDRQECTSSSTFVGSTIITSSTCRPLPPTFEVTYSAWAALISGNGGTPLWIAKGNDPIVNGKRADLERISARVQKKWIRATTRLAALVPE
jgi:hypothetical protein